VAVGDVVTRAVYYSINFGATWMQGMGVDPAATFTSVTMSPNGWYCVAVGGFDGHQVYTSENFGVTWSVDNVFDNGVDFADV
jgi:hypothetical protein